MFFYTNTGQFILVFCFFVSGNASQYTLLLFCFGFGFSGMAGHEDVDERKDGKGREAKAGLGGPREKGHFHRRAAHQAKRPLERE